MTFSEQHFTQRLAKMGDQAEAQFEAWATAKGISFVRYGLNRPEFKKFAKVSPFIRATPDFLCEGKTHFLVDAKGTGGEVIKSFKPKVMPYLAQWNDDTPLWFFLYDSRHKQVAFETFERVLEICNNSEVRRFPNDNNEYYHVSLEHFTWESVNERKHND